MGSNMNFIWRGVKNFWYGLKGLTDAHKYIVPRNSLDLYQNAKEIEDVYQNLDVPEIRAIMRDYARNNPFINGALKSLSGLTLGKDGFRFKWTGGRDKQPQEWSQFEKYPLKNGMQKNYIQLYMKQLQLR